MVVHVETHYRGYLLKQLADTLAAPTDDKLLGNILTATLSSYMFNIAKHGDVQYRHDLKFF